MPKPPHLTISAFVKHYAERGVDPLRALSVADLLRNAIETRRTIIELHALEQLTNQPGLWPPPHANEIFPLNFTRRVHEAMGKLAVGRKEQEA
jgi:hypothetical protein